MPSVTRIAARKDSLEVQLDRLRPQMAMVVQEVLDAWVQDADGYDEELGTGGPCDRVADAISDVISDAVFEAEFEAGGQDGDDHAWVVTVLDGKRVGVDVPHHLYETGGGYIWRKIPDVKIRPSDISIWRID